MTLKKILQINKGTIKTVTPLQVGEIVIIEINQHYRLGRGTEVLLQELISIATHYSTLHRKASNS